MTGWLWLRFWCLCKSVGCCRLQQFSLATVWHSTGMQIHGMCSEEWIVCALLRYTCPLRVLSIFWTCRRDILISISCMTRVKRTVQHRTGTRKVRRLTISTTNATFSNNSNRRMTNIRLALFGFLAERSCKPGRPYGVMYATLLGNPPPPSSAFTRLLILLHQLPMFWHG